MSTTNETLMSVFTEDELRVLMTAVSGYMCMKRNQNRSTVIERDVFNKVVETWNIAREANAIETVISSETTIGVAEYKMMEAMEMA